MTLVRGDVVTITCAMHDSWCCCARWAGLADVTHVHHAARIEVFSRTRGRTMKWNHHGDVWSSGRLRATVTKKEGSQ